MAHHLMQVNIRDSNPPRTLCTEPYISLHLLRILYPILFKFQPLLTTWIEKNWSSPLKRRTQSPTYNNG